MNVDTATLAEVGHVYAIYARAIDEKRFDLLDRVFTADAALAYVVGPHEFACRGEDAARHFQGFLEKCYWTGHLIAAPMVETAAAGVFATARVTATHLQRRRDGSLARWLVRGSYHDHLEHRDGRWLITRRHCVCVDEEGRFLDEDVEHYPVPAWIESGKLRP